jgi:hypothetical protein
MLPAMAAMNRREMAVLLLAAAAPLAAAEPDLAIRGYDPVAYFTLQRATPGDARFTHDWDEHRWQFVSARHRDLFKADPARYAPQFANFCAVALTRGELKPANPDYWLISEGRLYLFGKAAGPGMFQQDLSGSIERARRNLEQARPR